MGRKKKIDLENAEVVEVTEDEEMEAVGTMRKAFNSMKSEEAVDRVIDLFARTRDNSEFCMMMKKMKIF